MTLGKVLKIRSPNTIAYHTGSIRIVLWPATQGIRWGSSPKTVGDNQDFRGQVFQEKAIANLSIEGMEEGYPC